MSTEPHKRRWFQFRLRTLFILVAVLAILLSWLAHERRQVRARLQWLELHMQRGTLMDFKSPPAQPAWLRSLLGDYLNADLISLAVHDYDVVLIPHTIVIDESITPRHLRITDNVMPYLGGFKQLQDLDLSETHITDAGLVHLKGLVKLRALGLNRTPTTPEGRQKLRQALPKCYISPEP